MSRAPRALVLLILLAAGLGAGWMAGSAGKSQEEDARRAAKTEGRRGVVEAHSGPASRARAAAARVMSAGGLRNQTREVIELANSIPVAEIEEWLQSGQFRVTGGQLETLLQQILYARLLDADPERLLRFSLRADHAQTRDFMRSWAQADLAAAEDFMLSLKSSEQRAKVVGVVLEELAVHDPARVLDLVSRLELTQAASHAVSLAFKKLAETHRTELLEAAEGWPVSVRKPARQRGAAQWLLDDFAGALGWLVEQQDGQDLFGAAGSLDSRLGPLLLEHAATLPDGWLGDMIGRGSSGFAEGDPLGWMRADAEGLGISPEKLESVQRSAAKWLARDPEKREEVRALLREDSGLSDGARRSLLNTALSRWSAEEREEAENWVATLDDAEMREAAEERFEGDREATNDRFYGSETPTPESLIQAYSEEKPSYGSFYQARYWTARETEEMLAHWRALPEEGQDRVARNLVARDLRYGSPAIAAEAVSHVVRGEPGTEREQQRLVERASMVAARWGEIDPAAAGAWVRGLPAGETRQWAARNLIYAWRQNSESEARAWAEGLSAEDREVLAEYLK